MSLLPLFILASTAQSRDVDAYWSVEMKIGAVTGTVDRSENRLYLFKHGVALRGFYQKGFNFPPHIKLQTEKNDSRSGTWTKDGSKLTIKWGGGASPQTFNADNGSYKNSDVTWRPLKRVDAIRLDALFAREDPKHDGAQLMLRADGTFAFRNAHRINFIDLSKIAPNYGSGRYGIGDWTLTLMYKNGQHVSMSFELPHTQDAKTAEFLNIASQNFYRWPGSIPDPTVEGTPVASEFKVGCIIVPVPNDWRSFEGGSMISLQPKDLPTGIECRVAFVPEQKYEFSSETWHKSIWEPLTKDNKPEAGTRDEKVGIFLRSWTKITVGGKSSWISLYTSVQKGKGIAAMFVTDREELFVAGLAEVDAMMKGAKIAD